MTTDDLLIVLRFFIGYEDGFSGDGNEQWFYFLSLVINLMLVWWLAPEIALLFTILSVIHFLTVAIYGFFGLSGIATLSYIYFFIHYILILLATIGSLKWTAITVAITVISVLLAPNHIGNNIIYTCNATSKLPLLFNSLIILAFVIVTVLLPIDSWIKLVIILVALTLHPFIDSCGGMGIIISDVTSDVFRTMLHLDLS